MCKILSALTALILVGPMSYATNYYIAANGSDANPGTSIALPWQTLDALTQVNLAPGDTVFLRKGDRFRGTINLAQGGNAGAPLVITAYGTGQRPVISGAEVLNGWQVSGANYTVQVSSPSHGFFVDDKEQTIARYPNDHQYLWLDSAQTTYLKDSDLPNLASNLVNGAKMCIHTAQWCWEMTQLSALTGNRADYTTPTTVIGTPQYAYFLYDNLAHLDTAGEWVYVANTQTIHYQPEGGIDPNTVNCESSVLQYGIQTSFQASYIVIEGLKFEKQYGAGVYIAGQNNRHISISNCHFRNQDLNGVQDRGRYNSTSDCSFRHINGIAVYVNGPARGTNIHHNSFRRNGQFRNRGLGGQINLSAINLAFVDSCSVHHNEIDSTGYCGISADGGYHLVERNLIDHAMLINNDGAALKSFGVLSHHIVFRNNFVRYSDGNTEGTFQGTFMTPAIYFDFQVNNCQVLNNTIYNHTAKGIFMNSGTHDNTIKGNVIYGGRYLIDLNGSLLEGIPITGMDVSRNDLFALTPDADLYRQVDYTNTFNQGIIDTNRVFHPYDATHIGFRPNGAAGTHYSMPQWNALGYDQNASVGWLDWADNENYSMLVTNPTDNVATIALGDTLYLDLDSNMVCGSINLQPYTSAILINTGTTCVVISVDDIAVGDNLAIYPNPNSGSFTLALPTTEPTPIAVLDATGRLVFATTVVGSKAQIDLGACTPGLYVLRAMGKSAKVVVR